MKNKIKLYVGDTVAFLILCAVCVAILVFGNNIKNKESTMVQIKQDGKVVVEVDLKNNGEFKITDGFEVSVKDGKAFVSKTDCPDKYCTKMKPVTSVNSSQIVCVPNRIVIEKKAQNNGGNADVNVG